VPEAVVKSVKKRFPTAKITGSGKEDEEGQTVYELQIEEKSAKIDISLNPDGTIREIEKQITKTDLPKAVQRTLGEKYSKSRIKLVEEVVLVKDGKEALDCYEFKLAAGDKVTEVKIAPDGKVKKVEEQKGQDE
jgi:hypothetical protein